MNVESVKLKAAVVFFSIVFLLAAGSASAQTQPPIRITSISVPSTISHPLDGFTINFTLTGAKYGGLGAGLIGVDFYVSDTPSGSNGVYPLLSKTVHLNGSGYGPYTPPAGTLSAYVTPSGMDPNTVALLQSIVTGCQPQGWYILGYVWSTSLVSAWTTLGRVNQPDQFFSTGALSPTVIQPGGTTNISFTLFNQCLGSGASRVGIFLADANSQPLSFIGGVSVPGGSGVVSLPPTGITFSPSIPLGSYRIVLVADVDGVIAENNESNNVGSFPLTITSGAQPTVGRDAASLEMDGVLPDNASSTLCGLESGPPDAWLHGF